MSVLDILWLFFIISTLQPVIKQRYPRRVARSG